MQQVWILSPCPRLIHLTSADAPLFRSNQRDFTSWVPNAYPIDGPDYSKIISIKLNAVLKSYQAHFMGTQLRHHTLWFGSHPTL